MWFVLRFPVNNVDRFKSPLLQSGAKVFRCPRRTTYKKKEYNIALIEKIRAFSTRNQYDKITK